MLEGHKVQTDRRKTPYNTRFIQFGHSASAFAKAV
jgi:hypothetical protein